MAGLGVDIEIFGGKKKLASDISTVPTAATESSRCYQNLVVKQPIAPRLAATRSEGGSRKEVSGWICYLPLTSLCA